MSRALHGHKPMQKSYKWLLTNVLWFNSKAVLSKNYSLKMSKWWITNGHSPCSSVFKTAKLPQPSLITHKYSLLISFHNNVSIIKFDPASAFISQILASCRSRDDIKNPPTNAESNRPKDYPIIWKPVMLVAFSPLWGPRKRPRLRGPRKRRTR